jgi:hypothetical protein
MSAAAEATEEERQTAHGLARYAYEYIDAAILVDEKHGARKGYEFVSPVPAYFLAHHGLELTLKAFLRHHGMKPKELRSMKFGHDLKACYRKAKELGLRDVFKMKADDMRAMLLLVELNDFQGLRYIRTGFHRYPSWAIVEPLVVRLHQAVAEAIGARTFDRSYSAYL